jgi:hypothetical protein
MRQCEFATFARAHQANLLLVSMNWLKSAYCLEDEPLSHLRYWFGDRLVPCIDQRMVFIACNRVGTEKNAKGEGEF